MLETKKFLKELEKINLDESIWDKRYFIEKTEEFLNVYKISVEDIIKNKNLREKFLEYILNHYSTFFRDYEDFKFLRKIAKKPQKVLSLGCSKGEEVYSTAIIFYENGILDESFILGVDLEHIINEAKKGQWHISLYEEFERNYKLSDGKKNFRNYFIFEENRFKIKNFIKHKIEFKTYDLRKFLHLDKFDIIFFKNVSIYLSDKFLKKVYNWINKELTKGGYLFLGDNDWCTGYTFISDNVYQKRSDSDVLCCRI